MNLNRRRFLATSVAGIGAACSAQHMLSCPSPNTESIVQPAFGIIPVVSDGKWIWKDPPKEKGYLEPRDYKVSIGMSFTGQGNGTA